MLHRCIVSWGLVRRIARPIFLWDIKTIKMIIFMSPARYTRKHTHLSLIGGKTHDWVFAQLVVATAAAIIMVVHVVHTLNVVVAVVVVAACKIFFAYFVVDSKFVAGDPGHELAQYA